MIRERFAPSPTGRLHLGHAYSALLGFQAAQKMDGQWVLRIEDIDNFRSRTEFVDGIYEDLSWLGLEWPHPVLFQSQRKDAYADALDALRHLGVVYGCQCTRGDIALSAPHGDVSIYPGTCRHLNLQGDNLNWRLNAQKALSLLDELRYYEIGQDRHQWQTVEYVDDVVLARKDIGTSYHLAVVIDDAHQDITHVTRAEDLEDQTSIHVLLQALLKFPTPIYRHHKLIVDENGKRLAKRDKAREIKNYRENGFSLMDIKKMLFQ